MFVVKTKKPPSFEFYNTLESTVLAEISGGSIEDKQVLLNAGERFRVSGKKLIPLPVPSPVWIGEVKVALTRHEGNQATPGFIQLTPSSVHADFSQEFHQSGGACTHDGHVHIVFMDLRTWSAVELSYLLK